MNRRLRYGILSLFVPLCSVAGLARGQYVQTNLVSDKPGLATLTDPQLVNPWGLSHTATSPFWTSNQGENSATLFAVTGSVTVTKTVINPPLGFVSIPMTASGPQGPTGQVNNSNTSSFLVGNGGDGSSSHFIFANLNGSISAWDTGTTSFMQVTTAGALYTGLAVNQAQTELYAANGAGAGSINVFNSAFAPITLPAGAFATPAAISTLIPFNVQDIGGTVYVTYAPVGLANQRAATAGMGAVGLFDESGNLIRLINGSQLASPWGVAMAPANFGQFSNDLLVGNFSFAASGINAFDPTTGAFLGSIPIDPGAGNTAGGLWGLSFGTGGSNGSPNTLYFTDGINGEADGLFGALSVSVPEPASLLLIAIGGAALLGRRRRA